MGPSFVVSELQDPKEFAKPVTSHKHATKAIPRAFKRSELRRERAAFACGKSRETNPFIDEASFYPVAQDDRFSFGAFLAVPAVTRDGHRFDFHSVETEDRHGGGAYWMFTH